MRSHQKHAPTDTSLIAFLNQNKDAKKQRQIQLNRFIHQRGPEIRFALKQLADAIWPKQRLLGFLPVRSYRLRKEAKSGDFMWWVEHDIPPYDRYRCEAYAVKLSLNNQNETILKVLSGTNTYPVLQPLKSNIDKVLEKAVHDPPMVISRRMGAAHD